MKVIHLASTAIAILSGGFVFGAPTTAEAPSPTAGSVTYRISCTSCHGARAKGDGRVAQYLTVKPADLTRLSESNGGVFPAERIRATIDGRSEARGHGLRDMPVWGDVFSEDKGEDEARRKLDDLLAFIESIQVAGDTE